MNKPFIKKLNGVLNRIIILETVALFSMLLISQMGYLEYRIIFFTGFMAIFLISIFSRAEIGLLDLLWDKVYTDNMFILDYLFKIFKQGIDMLRYYNEPILIMDALFLGVITSRILLR